MANPPEEPSVESLIGSLRDDVEEMHGASRRRIGARLTVAVLLQGLGAAVVPWFLSRKFFHSKAFAVGLALPIGVAVGASGHAALQDRGAVVVEPREPVIAQVSSASPVVPAAAAPSLPSPPLEVVTTPPLPAPAASQRPVVRARAPRVFVGRDTLAPNRELSQLEKARTLLSEGQVDVTLAQVRKHVMTYPHSALEQERQALYIKALVAANRMIEARVRAATFVKRFPNSTLRGSIEKAVTSIP